MSTNGGYAFEVFGASDNLFQKNVVTGSNAFTIDSGASNNVLRRNRVIGNQEDGVEVFGGSGDVLQRNVIDENAGDGIVSDTNALILRANVTNRNGFPNGVADGAGLGISVPAGTIQSGNKATGNDDPHECQSSDLSCHVPEVER